MDAESPFPAPGGSSTLGNNANRKRRRNDDASSGGRGGFNGGRAGGGQGPRHGGRGRGGIGGRGRGHDNSSASGKGERRNENGREARRHGSENSQGRGARGRGTGRGNHNQNQGQGRNHRGRGGGGPNLNKKSNNHRNNIRHNSNHPRRVQLNSSVSENPFPNIVSGTSGTSSEASSVANDSDTTNVQAASHSNKTVTILLWPNPISHYIPIEEEERLLPVLIHWGQSERGMMKDQPPFRLQKIQKMLEGDRKAPPQKKGRDRHNGKQKNHSQHRQNGKQQQSNSLTSRSPTRQISLIQSLSLRRHHLKLLNPKYSMSSLRLGNEEDIRNAAALFEDSVDTYLRSHGVQFWTEEDQRKKFDETMKGVPIYQRKQPPTPDFMMKDGHCVTLSLHNDSGGEMNTLSSDEDNEATDTQQQHHPTSINWIEAKMFYGANTIPSGTPNAVGCILPKVQQYVALYGTGAIVFMYGCGSQLAAQLLEVGVVALDGRCLDLEAVEKHQRRWCGDSWGNILF